MPTTATKAASCLPGVSTMPGAAAPVNGIKPLVVDVTEETVEVLRTVEVPEE